MVGYVLILHHPMKNYLCTSHKKTLSHEKVSKTLHKFKRMAFNVKSRKLAKGEDGFWQVAAKDDNGFL